jgi:hypothetical protein
MLWIRFCSILMAECTLALCAQKCSTVPRGEGVGAAHCWFLHRRQGVYMWLDVADAWDPEPPAGSRCETCRADSLRGQAAIVRSICVKRGIPWRRGHLLREKRAYTDSQNLPNVGGIDIYHPLSAQPGRVRAA